MGAERERRTTRVPGWVKGFAAAGVLAVLALAMLLMSGHGPWQHFGMAGMH